MDARPLCRACRRALSTCFCSRIRPFEASCDFVVLVHPREARNRVGTARIIELGVRGTRLRVGTGRELDRDPFLREWVGDPSREVVVLYPGPGALDLGSPSARELGTGKRLTVLVIDGTWAMARKMVRESLVLSSLRQIAFSPRRPSSYRIRRQPAELCLSSVEAVHEVIECLARTGLGTLPVGRAHDGLLEVFDWMVALQIQFEREAHI